MFVSLIYCLGHIFKNFVDTGSILTVFLNKATTVVALWLKEALVVCFLLSNSLAPEFYMPMFRNTPSVPSS
jgi:hypothetical protein